MSHYSSAGLVVPVARLSDREIACHRWEPVLEVYGE